MHTYWLQRKKGDKNKESIQSIATSDPRYMYHPGKWQKHNLNMTNKSQEASPFPKSDHKAAMNRRETWQTQDINNTNGA